MKNKIKILLILVRLLWCSSLFGAYYDTLPSGVRNFTYRYVQTGNINSDYGTNGRTTGYDVNADINADSVKGIDSAIDLFLDSLSSDDYSSFSLGKFRGDASSLLSAHVFGGGIGITKNLTLYSHIAYYDAEVDLNLVRTKEGQSGVSGMGIDIENLPQIDEKLVQSFFVNYLDYEPLGKWKVQDVGDTEVGLMYKLFKNRTNGMKLTLGAVVPTGREDNPDIVQDISLGDGQWDAFIEIGGGVRKRWFSLDGWVRYDHQFETDKRLRLPEDEDFPLTSESGDVNVKYGNKIFATINPNIHVSRQITISPMYTFYYKEKDQFNSGIAETDRILAIDTEEISHTARMEIEYSTVSMFMKKKFPAPLSFKLMYHNVFAGKNTPKYDRFEFQLSLFF